MTNIKVFRILKYTLCVFCCLGLAHVAAQIPPSENSTQNLSSTTASVSSSASSSTDNAEAVIVKKKNIKAKKSTNKSKKHSKAKKKHPSKKSINNKIKNNKTVNKEAITSKSMPKNAKQAKGKKKSRISQIFQKTKSSQKSKKTTSAGGKSSKTALAKNKGQMNKPSAKAKSTKAKTLVKANVNPNVKAKTTTKNPKNLKKLVNRKSKANAKATTIAKASIAKTSKTNKAGKAKGVKTANKGKVLAKATATTVATTAVTVPKQNVESTKSQKPRYERSTDPQLALYDPNPTSKPSSVSMNYSEAKRYIYSRMQSETHSMLLDKIEDFEIPGWLRRTELDYNYWSFGKSKGFSLLTVQPLYLSDCHLDTVFFQGRVNRQTRFGESLWRMTYNLGVGYRKLLWDESVMLGANAFYDVENPYKHRRSSLGLELRTTAGEINTNFYFPQSRLIWTSGNTHERALQGWNVELGVPIPYTPWIKVYASKYRWDNVLFPRTDGHRFSVEITPVPFVRFEGGASKDNLTSKYKYFLKTELSFGFLGPDNYDHSGVFNQDPYILCPMNERTLDKVRRSDTIAVEKAHVSTPAPTPTTGTFVVIIRRLG